MDQQYDLFESPWGSVNDISMDGPSYDFSKDDTPREDSSFDSGSKIVEETGCESSREPFLDPLVNIINDSLLDLDMTIDDGITEKDINWTDDQHETFPIRIAMIVFYRFLSKKPGCDDDSRISHKVLAIKCLTSVFTSIKAIIRDFNAMSDDGEALFEIFNYISHGDDKLSIAAFEFYLTVQSARFFNDYSIGTIQFKNYLHQMLNGIIPMRIRGALEALKSNLSLILMDDRLCYIVFNYLVNLGWCTYFLVQCTRMELLALIDWKNTSSNVKNEFQTACFIAIVNELGNDDIRIRNAASIAFCNAIKNLYGNFLPTRFPIPSFTQFFWSVDEKEKSEMVMDQHAEKNLVHAFEILTTQLSSIQSDNHDKLVGFESNFCYGLVFCRCLLSLD